MVWFSVAGRRRLRRRIKQTWLSAQHAARRHYLTMVSLSVLVGVLGLALTSTSFERAGEPRTETPIVAVFAPSPTATPSVAPVLSTAPPEPRQVVYYVVDSESKRREIEMAVHIDISNEALRNYQPLHGTTRFFLVVKDARDEAEALEFLRMLATTPPDGFSVHVVDLR